MAYTPLDVILEQPATRLLRALRFFDWASPPDLFAAAGVPDWTDEGGCNPERNAASKALSRLVGEGMVERGHRSVDGYAHRLTTKGRRDLALRMRGVSRGRGSRARAPGRV